MENNQAITGRELIQLILSHQLENQPIYFMSRGGSCLVTDYLIDDENDLVLSSDYAK